jgi:hypothetical protein
MKEELITRRSAERERERERENMRFHTMKAYEMVIELHSFLTSAQEGRVVNRTP